MNPKNIIFLVNNSVDGVNNPCLVGDMKKHGEKETLRVIRSVMEIMKFSYAVFRAVHPGKLIRMLLCLKGMLWMHVYIYKAARKSPRIRRLKRGQFSLLRRRQG